MKQQRTGQAALLSTRGFYTVLVLCGLIIAISTWVLVRERIGGAEQEVHMSGAVSEPLFEPVQTMPDLIDPSVDAAAGEPSTPVVGDTADKAVQVNASTDEQTTAPQEEQAAAQAPVSAPAQTEAPAPPQAAEQAVSTEVSAAPQIYVRPVAGEVLTPFSGDELLFQPTMGDWRVHTGTDFAAQEGENVLCLTDGTVSEVTQSGLYGMTVSVLHAGQLQTKYCGLRESKVVEGQAVRAGEVLGECAHSMDAEAAQGTHLHLEATRAGEAIDVLELLGEADIE